eukprot:scaffold91433_cov35-Attheya_sp.AAC.1
MKLAAQLQNDHMVQDNLVEADAERNAYYEKFIHAHDKSDNAEHALDSVMKKVMMKMRIK